MTTDPFNSVYQGQEGTGAAFLLNGNKAAELFQANIARDEQMRRVAELQRQKEIAAQNTLIDRGISDIKPEEGWIAHDNYLRNQYTGLIDYAKKIKANGQNPLIDTEFKNKQARLKSEAAYSGQLLAGFNELQKEIQSKPGEYSEESIAKALSYYDPKKPIAQYLKEGIVQPPLQPKYTMSGMLKGLKGSAREYDKNGRIIKEADRGNNVKLVQGLEDTPAFRKFVTEAGAIPDLGAFPINNNGKTEYSTRDEVLLPIAQDLLSKIKPSEYDVFGITASSPEEATAQMLEIVRNQNRVYGNIVSSAADQLDAGVDKSNKTDWSAKTNERGWASLRFQEKKFANQVSRQNQSDSEKQDAFAKRNQMISDLRSQKPEALSKLNGLLSIDGGSAVYMANKKGAKLLRVKIKGESISGDPMMAAMLERLTGKKPNSGDNTVDIDLVDQSKLDALNKLLDKVGATSAEKKVNDNTAGVIDFGVEEEEVIDFGNN